jgi:hypothetical protein
MSDFEKELSNLINRYNQENASDTPDFILAQYLLGCLETFSETTKARDLWYGFKGLSRSQAEVIVVEQKKYSGINYPIDDGSSTPNTPNAMKDLPKGANS